MASVSIPVIGDKKYRNAFSAFARDNNTSMAKLVRKALDQVYGEQLQSYISFVASNGGQNHQTEVQPNSELESVP